ncbi:hypothetical protein QD47_08965 [Paenibacillus terrae]|uniref:Uncharacterized protein n=1 Tax=Paenibacillus terrae TaxID=159743 RepID=A0A0D7X3H3_9BACL|nr:hypothetical protein QD47_08965 [Paenibacillus terrae]
MDGYADELVGRQHLLVEGRDSKKEGWSKQGNKKASKMLGEKFALIFVFKENEFQKSMDQAKLSYFKVLDSEQMKMVQLRLKTS